jgi:hypothetical protein
MGKSNTQRKQQRGVGTEKRENWIGMWEALLYDNTEDRALKDMAKALRAAGYESATLDNTAAIWEAV